MRDATQARERKQKVIEISTHAPHAGRDLVTVDVGDLEVEISTHAPHAGRDSKKHSLVYGI